MQELARAVTDPASPRFRKFYTPAEIRALAAPTDAEYAAFVARLKAEGAKIVRESPTRLTLTVRAERSYLAGLTAAPEVVSIKGLVPSARRKPHLKILPMASKKDAFAGFSPAQIHTAYGFDAIYAQGITAKGQDIAIATYDSFKVADVKDYYTKNGVTPAPTVDQVSFNGTAKFDPESASETQTDAEFAGMIAPGAAIHVFASATNDDAGELAVFTAILDDGRAKVVNYSWGTCETSVTDAHRADMDAVFARAAAQGVSIQIASGDSGSDCQGDGSTVADFPAVEPYVVAVGGTNLSLDSNGLAQESAWSGSGADGGSGGGVSTLYAAPSWQSALPSDYSSGRAYPDVSFNADPASGQPTWIHFDPNNPTVTPKTAQYIVIGGTSIAAPQWTGFLALVNAARGTALGYAAPVLYQAAAAQAGSVFNDVTSGSNGAYTAGAGWDAVTGWGSMQASALLAYLKSN
jgi:kumamolisin